MTKEYTDNNGTDQSLEIDQRKLHGSLEHDKGGISYLW